MVNTSYKELLETKAQPIPIDATLESLKQFRDDMCSSSSRDFKLQGNQRFLRRVMSPDSVVRNLLMVHGTGVGKTCTAIQIAEEYIIRPEFQDKKVMVIANPSVQDNFKAQIFDITRVSKDDDGLVTSKQCTGRRYLDMIERSQAEPIKYTDKAAQLRITNLANKLIGEFYEFAGYITFSNMIEAKKINSTENELNTWIHKTFDNRLIIVDEAHNLKDTTESESNKLVALAIERIVKVANGVTLVLLTATPMYDTPEEILYYFNLFLWNDKRLSPDSLIRPSDIFTSNLDFKEGKEADFRGWCQDYVSFVKGENPFTFPFRLPPPVELVAQPDRTIDIDENPIKKQRTYLKLTQSIVSQLQEQAIKPLRVRAVTESQLICVFPENKTFRETFNKTDGYSYKNEQFLAPSKIALYSSKFSLITKIIAQTTGIVFIYSNIVESGAQLFAMCLEEHGYSSALGDRLLKETSGEVARGINGKFVLFTSNTSDSDIKKALIRLKSPTNADGSDIRIVIASPKVSEGVDFRFVRQIHILDPWFNMSRIEQVLGRGMRTCSHSLLPFQDQNCTVYLHVCRYAESTQETVDEYIYRIFVEEKAIRIAKVKRVVMESAMDCELQVHLPSEWTNFTVPQRRNQDGLELKLTISEMTAPMFEEKRDPVCNVKESIDDPNHERPLSAILDVKDEILDKILKLFINKPLWKKEDLYSHRLLKQYDEDVLSYILQSAIDSGFQLKDKFGRIGYLQSRKNTFAFTIGERDTLLDRLLRETKGTLIPLLDSVVPVVEEVAPTGEMNDLISNHEWSDAAKEFSREVLEWYYVDAIMKPEAKITYLLGIDWKNPPIYARPLFTKNLYVLGLKKIYNNKKELITPVGPEQDEYISWLNSAKDRFVENSSLIFASMKDGGLIFNIEDNEEIKKASRSKTIGGMACTSFKVGSLNALSMFLRGKPIGVKTKVDRCLILNLIIRAAILEGNKNIFWITPEEFQIFSEPSTSGEIRKRMKD